MSFKFVVFVVNGGVIALLITRLPKRRFEKKMKMYYIFKDVHEMSATVLSFDRDSK